MPEKPPAWTEFDTIGQVPLALSQDVKPSGAPRGQDLALAAQLIREQQPVINRFVARQRQQITIGGLDVHKAVLPLKDMEVYYSYVQGIERMHYHITPQVEEPLESPEVPEEETPETSIPQLEKPPELPEEAPPPEEELPEPEEAPEEEPEEPEEEPEEPELESPEFLSVDIPCFLAVEFGDGAGDP